MINSARYCAVIEEELKTVIHSKCRGMLSKEVVLHHGNAIWQQQPLKLSEN
jgi:hypothetical protein